MAKVRAYYDPDPYWGYTIVVRHWYWVDVYEPGAFHEIYPYAVGDIPPGYTCGQRIPTLEEGLITAHTWASMPALVNDLCVACRYFDYGANTPRWNIYRGEDRAKYYPGISMYPRRFIPGFVLHKDDPYPPGYGQPPE